MSDNNDTRSGFTRRVLSQSEKDQQEIQDWLNGDGAMVIAAVVFFVALFALVSVFL